MIARYTLSLDGLTVSSEYAEARACFDAGRQHPARVAGLTWDRAAKVWTGPAKCSTALENAVRDAVVAGVVVDLVWDWADQVTPAPAPAPAPKVDQVDQVPACGTYTVAWPDGTHTTLRLTEPWADYNGPDSDLVVSLLIGPDNGTDYRRIGTVDASGRLRVWKRAGGPDGYQRVAEACRVLYGARDAQAEAREAYALASGRCARCGRTLTVPASLHRGLGPDCADRI